MEYYAQIKKEDGVYLVSFFDLPNVMTYGETLEEAREHASDALNGVLASDFERGFVLPRSKKHTGKQIYAVTVYPHIALAYTLRTLRRKDSQQKIAKQLGISYQAYQRLENPRTCNPTVKTLERIGDVLGKDLKISFQ